MKYLEWRDEDGAQLPLIITQTEMDLLKEDWKSWEPEDFPRELVSLSPEDRVKSTGALRYALVRYALDNSLT
jgi:hypothetical protein